MPPCLAGLDEARLCSILANSPWSRSQVTVVCDGNPKPTSPAPQAVEPIHLIFSGASRCADEIITQLIETDSAPRRLTVVSNDREIQKAARRRRCRILSCERFIHGLESAATPSRHPAPDVLSKQKHGVMAKQEIRWWLREFGVEIDEEDDTDDDLWEEYWG